MKATPLLSEEEILERRAQRLAAPLAAVREEPMEWVAEFPVGNERFALPLEQLRAALPVSLVTPVPLSPAHVIGVLRYQGELLSALSLASLLGGRGWGQDPAVLLVVAPGPGRLVAFDCEQVPRALALPRAALEAARARGPAPVHEVTFAQRAVQLIDLEALLARRAEARHAD